MKKKILMILMAGLIIGACKNKKNDPTPDPKDTTSIIVPTPVVEIRGIKLYNQALDTVANPHLYNFYNITSKKYNNSVNFPIEIAFVHNQPTDNSSKHLLGCATSDIVISKHGIPSENKTNVEFYKINNGSNTLLYDTISLSASIGTIFSTKATKSNVNGESNAIQSDGFGWDEGDIFGFKLSNGKRGLILLTAKPTGIKDPDVGIIIGNIQFDIKMEK